MYKCWLLKKGYTAFLRTFNRAKPQLMKGRLMQEPQLHTWRSHPTQGGLLSHHWKVGFQRISQKLESHFCPTNRPRSGGFQNAWNSSLAHWSQVTQFRWHLGSGGGCVEMVQWNIPWLPELSLDRSSPRTALFWHSFSERSTHTCSTFCLSHRRERPADLAANRTCVFRFSSCGSSRLFGSHSNYKTFSFTLERGFWLPLSCDFRKPVHWVFPTLPTVPFIFRPERELHDFTALPSAPSATLKAKGKEWNLAELANGKYSIQKHQFLSLKGPLGYVDIPKMDYDPSSHQSLLLCPHKVLSGHYGASFVSTSFSTAFMDLRNLMQQKMIWLK